jgi:acetate kinase
VNVAHATDAIGHALDWFVQQDLFTSVNVIRTDEEMMIARSVFRMLGNAND